MMFGALDKYHGLPNGMFSCDEHFAGRIASPRLQACTVVETMFSLEQSLAILGDASLGDRLGKLALTRCPAPLWTICGRTNTMKDQPGRVQPAPQTVDHRRPRIEPSLGLEPNFGCCTANFHLG